LKSASSEKVWRPPLPVTSMVPISRAFAGVPEVKTWNSQVGGRAASVAPADVKVVDPQPDSRDATMRRTLRTFIGDLQ
jgi:hypothetical protein